MAKRYSVFSTTQNPIGANTFLGGNGSALVPRTAAQVRTSCDLDRRVPIDAEDLIALACDDAAGPIANTGSAGGTFAVAGAPILGRQGIHETCITFTGNAADRITGPTGIPVEPAAEVNVSLWLRVAAFGAARALIRPYGAAWIAPWTSASIYLDAGGVPSMSVNVGATERSPNLAGLGVRCQLGVWHHLGVSYDGTNVRAYFDGSEVGTAVAIVGTPDWGTPGIDWTIGALPFGPAEAFNGGVDDVRVAGVAMAASWWREVYRRGVGIYNP